MSDEEQTRDQIEKEIVINDEPVESFQEAIIAKHNPKQKQNRKPK